MHKLYTLGYAGWTADQVGEAVARRDAVLVDIRLKPFSRKPGFHGARLRRTLGAWGEEPGGRYLWVQGFGNLNYKGGPVSLADPNAGMALVKRMLDQAPVVLLCACADLMTCHRRQVAELLATRLGVEIEHLPAPAADGMPANSY